MSKNQKSYEKVGGIHVLNGNIVVTCINSRFIVVCFLHRVVVNNVKCLIILYQVNICCGFVQTRMSYLFLILTLLHCKIIFQDLNIHCILIYKPHLLSFDNSVLT